MRLILDGTSCRVRLDRKATSISLLVVLGACGGQKVLLAIKSRAARVPRPGRTVLDDLISAGCGGPSSSSSTARRLDRPLPPSGTECRSSAHSPQAQEPFRARSRAPA